MRRPAFVLFELLFFVFVFFNASGQQVEGQLGPQRLATLSGRVTDKNKIPLPAVSIYIKGSTQGTVTNSEGFYHLTNIELGLKTLVVSFIGYKLQEYPVTFKAEGNASLNITLEEGSFSLAEVSVNAEREDKAVQIMRQVMLKRNFYANQLQDYRCKVYIKGIQKLRNAPKKLLGRDVQGSLKEMGLDSGKKGILYLSESVSNLAVHKPGQMHEEMISSKVSGKSNGFSFNQATDLMVDFYQSVVDLRPVDTKKFISPLASNGFAVYQYKYEGSSTDNQGHTVFKILVIPKRKGANLFEGRLYVRSQTWNLEATDLRIASQSKIEFLDTLRVRQQFMEPKPGIFVLGTVEFMFNFKVLGFDVAGNYLESLTNYNIKPNFSRADFPKDVVRILASSNKKDSSYWDSVRPIPLSSEESRDYLRKDSIARVHESRKYLDSIDDVRSRSKIGKILLQGQTFQNSLAKSKILIPPLGFVVSYNTVEGLAFNPEVTYSKKTSDTTSFSFSTSIRYGFAIKRLNPSASLTLNLNTLRSERLTLSGGYQILDQNRLKAIVPLLNTYQTVFSKLNILKLYEKHFLSLGYSVNVLPQFNLEASIEYANRIPLINTAYEYISGKADRHFTANNPFSPSGNSAAFDISQAAVLDISVRYNLGEKFVVRPDLVTSLGSRYPSLMVNYRKGIAGLLHSATDFDYLSAAVDQQDVPIGTVGTISYRLSGGKFISSKNLSYLDYQPFTNVQSTFLRRFDGFQILNAYRYSASDYFFSGHVEQNFKGAIFSKVPLLRKLRLEETAGALFMRNDKLNNYTELYFGIQRYGIRLAYAISYLDSKHYLNGFTVSLK